MESKPNTAVLVFRRIKKVDHYYEDPNSDYGTEHHSLETKSDSVVFIECPVEDAYRKKDDALEENASDPPYLQINFICAYLKDTKRWLTSYELECYARRNDDGEIA